MESAAIPVPAYTFAAEEYSQEKDRLISQARLEATVEKAEAEIASRIAAEMVAEEPEAREAR